MNQSFYLEENSCFFLKVLRFLCFWLIQEFEICDAIKDITVIQNYTFNCFCQILGNTKIKFDQVLSKLMTTISTWF